MPSSARVNSAISGKRVPTARTGSKSPLMVMQAAGRKVSCLENSMPNFSYNSGWVETAASMAVK